jgi:long-chain acyl-CoA synthetase
MTIAGNIPAQRTLNGHSFNEDLTKGPYYFDGCDTLPKLFRESTKRWDQKIAHREKDYGIWLAYTWAEFYNNARLIGLGLLSLGLKRGEVVSILSEDNKEWLYTDLGVQSVGGIASGVYTTDSASQLKYLVNDSDSRFLFLDNDEQLDKYLSVRDDMPGLSWVIVYDRDGLHGFSDDKVIFLDDLYRLGREFLKQHPNRFEEEIANSSPKDTAILVYTSGTTGPPKGAMISHENIIVSIIGGALTLPVTESDEQVCFLPLCHILERLITVFLPIGFGSTVNFAESPETVFDNVREVSPHVYTAVPRVWEKVYSRISIMSGEATKLGKLCYKLALATGMKRAEYLEDRKPVPLTTSLAYAFWDFAVLKNLRRMIGLDRLRRGTTGAAPISPDLLRWYKAIGVTVLEGYGMTESSGVISLNSMDAYKTGSIGKVVPGSEVKIAPDGEILYRGGNVFKGYWNKPEKTAETMVDGWLNTGDTYRQDEDGYFIYDGRSDDMLKVGGIWCSPVEVESCLIAHPAVLEAAVVGHADEHSLIKPKAFVVLKQAGGGGPGLTDELMALCKTTLAPYKYPRWVEYVPELPKTATGKIQRYKLRG